MAPRNHSEGLSPAFQRYSPTQNSYDQTPFEIMESEEARKNEGVHVGVNAPQRQTWQSDEVPSSEDEKLSRSTSSNSASEKTGISAKIRDWTALMLLISYFVFSISFYTLLNYEATKVFWFLNLTIATLVAGITALEAYDGLTPLREARKSVQKAEKEGQKFKTAEENLPPLNLLFDLVDRDSSADLATLKQLRNGLLYPSPMVNINVLCREQSRIHALSSDFDESLERAGVSIQAIPNSSAYSLAGRVSAFLAGTNVADNAVIAIFSGNQRPHPHAVRHAVEKLSQDAKIDVIQGRSITVPQASRSSFFAALANLEHDMLHALLWPGRSITWGLSVAANTNAYWKADKLRKAATATAIVPQDGMDLGYAAAGQRTRTVYDLRVIAYEATPTSFKQYLRSRVRLARELTMATVRYTKLVVSRSSPKGTPKEKRPVKPVDGKWGQKTRFAVLYALPIMRVVTHSIVQYLCLALAILFTDTPTSTFDFSRKVFFPLPISEWFMIGGLVCLISTVFMLYKARSEFVPLWTAPIVLVMYPLLVEFWAVIDVYGQLDTLVR